MAKKKTEEEILFPTAKVGKYKVEPWNFGILFEISDKVDRIVRKFEERGIENQLTLDEGFVPYTVLLKIFTLCSQELLEMIAITLGVEIDEIKQLSMEDGVALAFTIFRQNSTVIKNSLAPLFQILAEINEEEETDEEGAEVEESSQ